MEKEVHQNFSWGNILFDLLPIRIALLLHEHRYAFVMSWDSDDFGVTCIVDSTCTRRIDVPHAY